MEAVLSNADVVASNLMSDRFLAFPKEARAGDVLRASGPPPANDEASPTSTSSSARTNCCSGWWTCATWSLRPRTPPSGKLMTSPVVAADRDCLRADVVGLLAKYQFRMLPVVDAHDHLLGIVRYKDLMKDAKIELPN